VAETRRIADAAAPHGITVAFEFHANTLTDTNASAVQLMKEVGHPRVGSYWQPPTGLPHADCQAGLRGVLPWLTHLHAYAWSEKGERGPLAAGADRWASYLQIARSTGRDHFVMLEFVRGDDLKAFAADAATLKKWLA
jgi:sugar phosphate isomerase/epimerase